MTLAETSVLITNALINLQQYCQDHVDAEKRIQRVITKLQTYANKDTSISTQQVEVSPLTFSVYKHRNSTLKLLYLLG